MTKQKGFITSLIIIILAAAASAGGYFIYQKQIKSSLSKTTQQTIEPSPSPSDETAGWKTYTEPNGMLSFKYPETVNQGKVNILHETNFSEDVLLEDVLTVIRKDKNFSPQNVLTRVSIDHPYSLTYPNGESDPFTITITAWRNKEDITNEQVKTYLLSYKTPPGPYHGSYVDIQDYQNGEIKGIYYIVRSDQEHEEVYMATKSRIYNFTFNSESTSTAGKTRRLVDQILSTFKFTQ